MDNDDDPEVFLFMDPFALLEGLVLNSPELHVKAALVGTVRALLNSDAEEVSAAEVLEMIARSVLYGHICTRECEQQEILAENEDLIAKFRRDLGLPDEEENNGNPGV